MNTYVLIALAVLYLLIALGIGVYNYMYPRPVFATGQTTTCAAATGMAVIDWLAIIPALTAAIIFAVLIFI